MLPWKSIISVDENSEKRVSLQIADAIIEEIKQGRVSSGEKLPGTRILAELVAVNRKTIQAAYEELLTQGWVKSIKGGGTYVAESLPLIAYDELHPKSQNDSAFLVDDERKSKLAPLQLTFQNKIWIDDGIPDVRQAPLSQLYRYYRALASRPVFSSLLKYGHVEGNIDLRKTLTTYLHQSRGIVSNQDEIFITRGSQMGLYLIVSALVKPGDQCVTGLPGYSLVDRMIENQGGSVHHANVDANGLDVDQIERLCRSYRLKLVYTTPHHHYPTTVTLAAERRKRLVELAHEYHFLIIEDDYDFDYHYEKRSILPMASTRHNGHVIYVGSFSKCLAPVVRVGYVVSTPAILSELNKLRRIIDRQGDPLLERALSDFILNGDLTRHLKKTLRLYENRRNHFCGLLKSELSQMVEFKIPEGGMAVWITFRNQQQLAMLPDKLNREGYLMETDNVFRDNFSSIRCGFASMDKKEADNFVMVLRRVIS